jgi:hypothetical protein
MEKGEEAPIFSNPFKEISNSKREFLALGQWKGNKSFSFPFSPINGPLSILEPMTIGGNGSSSN